MLPIEEVIPSIPDYEPLRRIGRGSYGDVWLARGVTGAFRAVKIVSRGHFPDARPYEREFEGIVRFTAVSLREPSQLALLHVGRSATDDYFYYVMELADDVTRGREIDPENYQALTLQELFRRRGRLPVAEVVPLGIALARALASLHAAGLVHRDIKPSNIIFVGGVPKLADVGLVAPASESLTFVGTEGFVPPEGPGAPAADVFSFGKVLYELATGLDRTRFPRLPPDLDGWSDRKEFMELNEVLIRACEPDARRRFSDASTLLDDLLLVQAGKSVRRLRNAEKRTRQVLRVAAVLAVIAGIAGVGAWVERGRANEELALREQAEAQRDDLRRKTIYSTGLASAQRALETGDWGRARKRLEEIAPKPGATDLRGLEWYALRREAQGDAAVVLGQARSALQTVRFSPDGRLVATHGGDQQITVYNAATNRSSRVIGGVFRFVDFSSDSAWLVGVNQKAGLQRWAVSTGKPEGPAVDENRTNRPIAAIGPDQVAAFTDGARGAAHVVRIWDFRQHAETARWSLPPDPSGASWDYYRAVISSDGGRCALALISGRAQNARWKLIVYDFATSRPVYVEETPHRLTALRFNADASQLAVALGDTAEVASLEVAASKWRWKRKIGVGQTDGLAFSPDGRRLAAGGRDAIVYVLDSATGDQIATQRGHEAGVSDLSWSCSGPQLASSGIAGDLRLWQNPLVSTATELTGLWRPAGGGRKVCLSPDGALIAATDAPTSGALIASLDSLQPRARIPAGFLPVFFESEANDLVGLLSNGMFQKWRLTPEVALLDSGPLFRDPVLLGSSAAVSADGRTLGVGATDGRLLFCQLPGRDRVETVRGHTGVVTFVAVSPDGRHAVSGSTGNESRAVLWQTSPVKLVDTFRLATRYPTSGTFSSDGRYFVVGWSDGTLEVRQTESGRRLRVIQTDSSLVQCLAMSPDGTRLVCGGSSGAIHVLSTDDWREVVTLQINQKPGEVSDTTVSSLAFANDGNALAAYVNDGRIRVWRR